MIAEKPNLNRLQLNEIMMDVGDGGMQGVCQETTTHAGHEKEYNDKKSYLRDKNSRKKQQKEGKQKMQEMYQRNENMLIGKKVVQKG